MSDWPRELPTRKRKAAPSGAQLTEPKRVKWGGSGWTRARAFYADYVSVRYRPALRLATNAIPPGFAAYSDTESIVLPGRLGATRLRAVSDALGYDAPELASAASAAAVPEPGAAAPEPELALVAREARIAWIEARGRALPWLHDAIVTEKDAALAALLRHANRVVDGINRGMRECAATLQRPAHAEALPPLRMRWAWKSRGGVQHLLSEQYLRGSPTAAMRRPPDDRALARRYAQGDPAAAAWRAAAFAGSGAGQQHGRLETLLLEGDDGALMAAFQRALRQQAPEAVPRHARAPQIGTFPRERKFDFPHAGFRDFVVAAWEAVGKRRTGHPERRFKTERDWVEEGAGTAAAYRQLATPAQRQDAWARWAARATGAAWAALPAAERQRWRYPNVRILDSIPQLVACLDRIFQQYRLFVRPADRDAYVACVRGTLVAAFPANGDELRFHASALELE